MYLTMGSLLVHSQDIIIEPPGDLNGHDADLWEMVVELSHSEDCLLPCWWGFELEETTIEEIIGFLESTELNRSQQRSVYPDIAQKVYIQDEGYWLDFVDVFENDGDISEISYHFDFTEDGKLRAIHFVYHLPDVWLTDEQNALDISKILNQFEQDPDIFTSISPNRYADELPLYILYPEDNIIFSYWLNYDYPLICIDVDHLEWIDVEVPSDETVEDFESSEYMVPINEKWRFEGITTEEFVAFFRDNPDDCLDITAYPREEK